MIRKLKRKFVILSMISLLVLLMFIVVGMNLLNYRSVVEEADAILSVLSQNKGMFPDMAGRPDDRFSPRFSLETPYESRFFTVFYNETGRTVDVDVRKIASVSKEDAVNLADTVMSRGDLSGFAGVYRYMVDRVLGGTRVTFLDCGRRLDFFYQFLVSSVLMSALGFGVVFAVILILSGKIIRPIAEAYEKQKRFITDAGHEIKTPLTIINANVDILEIELGGENESLADIKGQTERLKSLTEDLVMLSRMEEAEDKLLKIEFPVSEVVSEAVGAFRILAASENKEFVCRIEPMLTLNGNDKSIRQLVSIFLDNALKYSPDGSRIEFTLARQGRTICLSVSNITEFDLNPGQLERIFDRFYRTDSSRNSETGGHGIGLSVAKAIVTAHGGRIAAAMEGEKTFVISAFFQAQ